MDCTLGILGDNDNDNDDLELGLSIGGGGLKIKEEVSRILINKDFSSSMSSCSSSSSSSSVDFPVSSISGTTSTSVIGWPPISRAHRKPIMANRIKSEDEEFKSRDINKNQSKGYLCVKVNMEGTLIGRKVDLNAHNSYETLAQTLEDMFYGTRSKEAVECSRLLNETSEFVLTYEDKDGDCMLVGDVPWQMFISSVKRLRILRNPR